MARPVALFLFPMTVFQFWQNLSDSFNILITPEPDSHIAHSLHFWSRELFACQVPLQCHQADSQLLCRLTPGIATQQRRCRCRRHAHVRKRPASLPRSLTWDRRN